MSLRHIIALFDVSSDYLACYLDLVERSLHLELAEQPELEQPLLEAVSLSDLFRIHPGQVQISLGGCTDPILPLYR